jgi:hypothetical protein
MGIRHRAGSALAETGEKQRPQHFIYLTVPQVGIGHLGIFIKPAGRFLLDINGNQLLNMEFRFT